MSRENLDNLVRVGHLKVEEPSSEEIEGLISSGRDRLADSKIESLSMVSRFDLAYNAAHALSLAALRKIGYRTDKRYIVFQCLAHTLDLPSEQWRVLDQAHRKRNIAEYEGDVVIDESLLHSLIRVAEEVSVRLG